LEFPMTNDVPPGVSSRRHQMFPVLTAPEIARIRRFGTVHHYERGARLFAAGEPGPGMFVVLKGSIAISQHDGLGHIVPVVRHEPGEFSAEVGQLSGGHALVDGYADEDLISRRFSCRPRSFVPLSSPKRISESASSGP
jgi:thioredoxin reductase (NADPH)